MFFSFPFYVLINMFCQSEAAVHCGSSKTALLKILQYSQKNTRVGVFFLKLNATLLKKRL